MNRKRLKALIGVLFQCMAMGELATAFIGFPALIDYCKLRIDWWAGYLPIVMLINSVAATILLMYCGVKMMHDNSLFTDEQSNKINNKISRWIEKRKYGYCKSDYNIVVKEVTK